MTTGPVHLRFAQPEAVAGTGLDRDRVVPAVVLRDTDGGEVRPTVFRQQRALVLAFLHADCAECEAFAAQAAARRDSLVAAGGEIRAILGRPAKSALPAWLDEEEQARQTFLGPDGSVPTLVVLDRYAAAQSGYPAADHDFPELDELVSELDWLAVQCPECST